MKNLFILLGLLFFVACQAEKTADAVTDQKATAAKVATTVPAKTVRDTTKKPVVRQHANYSRSTARQKNQIEAKYPYDIDLKSPKGKVVASNELLKDNGKPTVLLFWLSTCLPCAMEMKAISEKYAGWEKEADFNFYAISTDFAKNFPRFQKKIEAGQWPWETYNDVNREFRQILPGGLNGLPQTFLLDKNGEIVYHKRKYRPGDEDILFEKVKVLANK